MYHWVIDKTLIKSQIDWLKKTLSSSAPYHKFYKFSHFNFLKEIIFTYYLYLKFITEVLFSRIQAACELIFLSRGIIFFIIEALYIWALDSWKVFIDHSL